MGGLLINCINCNICYFLFFHLDCAALFAISERCLAERFSALAFPPFNPPSLPKATAAGFLNDWDGDGSASSTHCPVSAVDCATIDEAIWFKSPTLRLLERLGMAQDCPCRGRMPEKSEKSNGKLYHYRFLILFSRVLKPSSPPP